MDAETLRSQYDSILSIDIRDASDMKRLIDEYSDSVAAGDEYILINEIHSNANLNDSTLASAHDRAVRQLKPIHERYRHLLKQKIYENRDLLGDWEETYAAFGRRVECEQRTYCDANTELIVEEARLVRRYHELRADEPLVFDDNEYDDQSLTELSRDVSPDRRRQIWLTQTRHHHRNADEINEVFDCLVALRGKMARNAGFDDYVGYSFCAMGRTDYGPLEARQLHERIERDIVAQSPDDRGLAHLKSPHDHRSSYREKVNLSVDEAIADATEILRAVDEDFARQFIGIVNSDNADLARRPDKIPGAYCWTLQNRRQPYLLMNPTGTERDLWTLLHEGGHAIHALACSHHALVDYREPPLEMQELAAYFFEFLGTLHLEAIYPAEVAKKARTAFDQRMRRMVAWLCVGDVFQHWVYQNPGHSNTDRGQKWVELRKRFGLSEDWSEYEDLLACEWQSVPHFFQYPFYSIDYIVAICGAQELRERAETEGRNTIRCFSAAMALGGSRSLDNLWSTAGLDLTVG